MVEVSAGELAELIEQVCWLVGLPPTWVAEATSEEAAALANALKAARFAREQSWTDIEAGRWPA